MLSIIILRRNVGSEWMNILPNNMLLYVATLFFVIFLLFSVNTIYSLMSFAGIVFCVFLFLLTSSFEFFALIYLLIYIGAIIVFFLFSIMLLHLKFERIFEFEVSHTPAMLLFVILNFFITIGLRIDTTHLSNTFQTQYLNEHMYSDMCGDSFGGCRKGTR